MGDIKAFPTIRNVLYSGNNIITLTATNAVKAGMVVEIDATGVSGAVNAAVAEASSHPIGVALHDIAAGAKGAIALQGCVVYVAQADDTATIDAGDYLETNDNTVGGTVSTAAEAATGGATVTSHFQVIGIALDDIAASGTGRMLITGPMCLTQANSS